MVSLLLTLDTTPPLAPSLAVVGGDGQVLTLTSDPVVLARLSCSVPPSVLLGEYKVWGDVDPAAYGAVQATEAASAWVTYSDPLVPVRLAAGGGTKALYGRLRDDLRNPTAVLAAQVLLDTSYPSVSVLSGPDRARLSMQAGYRACAFTWAPNSDAVRYVVRAVPGVGSSYQAGSPVGTTNGSTNVAGTLALPAGVPVLTLLDAADLGAASPGDGFKVIKVFVQDGAGRWSL